MATENTGGPCHEAARGGGTTRVYSQMIDLRRVSAHEEEDHPLGSRRGKVKNQSLKTQFTPFGWSFDNLRSTF